MSYPDKPNITYSYTGFAAGQGTNAFPGTQLENDMAVLQSSISITEVKV